MQYIELSGANTHNLKNISLKIPKNKFVVVTGVSGSGKSSLLIDTLYNYSKKMYLEALASNANIYNSLEYEVDYINGTQAPIALEQTKQRFNNPRSTIGTLLGLEGYFRILFAILGTPSCPLCESITDQNNYCKNCDFEAEELIPQNFSSNHKDGMCLECNGLGKKLTFSENKIVPDANKSLRWIWDHAQNHTFSNPGNLKVFELLCEADGVSMDTPFKDVPVDFQEKFFYGDSRLFTIKVRKVTNQWQHPGVINYLEKQYKKTSSQSRQKAIEYYLEDVICKECHGGKLRNESMKILVNGKNYSEVQSLNSYKLFDFIDSLKISDVKKSVLNRTLAQVKIKINQICNLGLEYLSMSRVISTLSSGEVQKLLISKHVSSDLTGVMYILDEPTIGMHERDTENLIAILNQLRDKGNSVFVIEHDEKVIENADFIIEVGPGAGKNGGEIVAIGSYNEVSTNENSLISSTKHINVRGSLGSIPEKYLEFEGLNKNNLKDVSVKFPLHHMICVSGVSGAGKSSLVKEIYRELVTYKDNPKKSKVKTYQDIDQILYIDQKPIGGSSRSNVATYIDIYKHIRELFAKQSHAKEQKIEPSAFSLNVEGGRCENCKGFGMLEIDMYFMKNEYVVCDHCNGKRFNEQILQITYNGYDINRILELTIEEALEVFNSPETKKIHKGLDLLHKFGLGYLKLGQTTDTLSGGEGQRIKLISELYKGKKSKSLFIFDEPTTGLHKLDIVKLSNIFNELIKSGHTIIAIEHNLDIISMADYIIDIGPEGGDKGGEIIVAGNCNSLIGCKESITGHYLKKYLNTASVEIPEHA